MLESLIITLVPRGADAGPIIQIRELAVKVWFLAAELVNIPFP
jgi:hypothetical protein